MKILNFKSLILNLQPFCVAACLLFAGAAHAAVWQWIDGPRVQNQLKEGSGLWLIDVRSAAAYEAFHIEGSVNIPADALAHKKFSLQKTLILVDDSLGQRSAREAADALVKKGHERVSVVEGGIVAWQIEGLPLVERNNLPVRGVTAAELKWASANSVPMKIYDLRDEKKRKQEPSQSSEPVAGKTLDERVEKLKSILTGKEKKKDLAARMQKIQPVVLIFSAADDAEGYTKKIVQSAKGDIRYLIGGYEATISEKLRKQQTAGACPTCPGSVR